jgi:hypothetical protein
VLVTANWDAGHKKVTSLTINASSGIWLVYAGTVTWKVSGLDANQKVQVSKLVSDRPLDTEGTRGVSPTTLSLDKKVEFPSIPLEDVSLGDLDDPVTKESRRVVDYRITLPGHPGTADSYLVIDTSGQPTGGGTGGMDGGGTGGSKKYPRPRQPRSERKPAQE